MKFNLQRGVIITIAFAILSSGSALYILSAVINYNELYPAEGALVAQIMGLVVQKGAQPSDTVLIAHLVIVDPSDYSGLKLASSSIQLSRALSNQSKNLMGPTQTAMADVIVNSPLQPHSSLHSDITVRLPTENASYLYNLNQSSIMRLALHATITFDIIDFLNPVTGHVQVQDSEDVFLSN
jgi:hypothetical protein